MKQMFVTLIILVIGFYLLVNVGKRVYDLYRTTDRLTQTDSKLNEIKDKNDQLKKELAFRQSDFFVEKEAREKLNLAKPGEKVAVIAGQEQVYIGQNKTQEIKVPNWQKWYQFFFED